MLNHLIQYSFMTYFDTQMPSIASSIYGNFLIRILYSGGLQEKDSRLMFPFDEFLK